jgi:hypothetical protein
MDSNLARGLLSKDLGQVCPWAAVEAESRLPSVGQTICLEGDRWGRTRQRLVGAQISRLRT